MKERIHQGIGISPGVAIGTVFVMETARPTVWMHRIASAEVESEVERFHAAIGQTREGLLDLKERISAEMGAEHAYIFDAHLLMLEDPMLVSGVTDQIRASRINAEYALQQVTNELSRVFSTFEDAYLKERGVDVLDVANRIQSQLSKPLVGARETLPAEPSILLAHEIAPSKLASLDTKNILALALDVGGQTTHTGLLARAKNIPALVGLHDTSVIARTGDRAIVDGTEGVLILRPLPETLDKYRRRQQLFEQREEELIEIRDEPSVTTDGVTVDLLANVELTEELEAAFNRFGARGIGLYRSEYIFLSSPGLMPTDHDHEEYYRTLAQAAGDRAVTIRTMDLGGEKGMESLEMPVEANPALGLRAVRFSLKKKPMFKAQLRGILRASTAGSIRILIPMISGVGEVRQVKALLEECKNDLLREGITFRENIPLGVMVEVPSAAIIADIIAREVDFISVGTNDLIQYVLAIDRGNEAVAYLYEPFHPAVLRVLAQIVTAVEPSGKPLAMCGEMAADPIATPLLIGMGYHELSMNPMNIPVVKQVVRAVSAEMCRELARQALTIPTVVELQDFLRQRFEEHYPILKDIKLGVPFGDTKHES